MVDAKWSNGRMAWKVMVIVSFPAFLLAARFIPWDRVPLTCAFLRLTGYPCPTCGITRSVMALARLDLNQAAAMNPLSVPFVGILALWWIISLYEIATRKQTRLTRWAGRRMHLLALAAFVVVLLFGALRIWMPGLA
jgi:hypothetical protein